MTETQAIGIVSLLCALILFGASARRWRRIGAPVGRHAMIWAAFFGAAFAIALLVGHG